MKNKIKAKSLLDRKLENNAYRERAAQGYSAFKLEVQILDALEKRGWSYTDLARATNTQKSNVSRDLRAGRILSASFSRIHRIADVLGMKLIALLVPKEYAEYILPKIEESIRMTSNSSFYEAKLSVTPPLATDLQQGRQPNSTSGYVSKQEYSFVFDLGPLAPKLD